jgi:hypothetical protein
MLGTPCLPHILDNCSNPVVSQPLGNMPPGVIQAAYCVATTVATTGGTANGAVTVMPLIFTTATAATALHTQERANAMQTTSLVVTDLHSVGEHAFTVNMLTQTPTVGGNPIAVQGRVVLTVDLLVSSHPDDNLAEAEQLVNAILAHLCEHGEQDVAEE